MLSCGLPPWERGYVVRFEPAAGLREEFRRLADLEGNPVKHPELGVRFSSGRLGHLWPFVNGVALAHRDQVVVMFGSDGSQQEGTDAEAARLAVAQNLNVKVVIDDNNVTIAGHPREYLPGYDVARTLDPRDTTGFVSSGLLWMQKGFFDAPDAVEYHRPALGGHFASYREEPSFLKAEKYLDIDITSPHDA